MVHYNRKMNETRLNNHKIVQNNIDSPLIAKKIQKCPECGSKNIITDDKRAEIFCADCGIVLREKIVDLGPEWREFDTEQQSNRRRTGPPMNYRLHDKGLGNLESAKRHIHIFSNTERRAIHLLTEIDRICSNLNLSNDFKEMASLLCHKVVKDKFGKYQDRLSLATAMVYLICEKENTPKSLKEIIEASGTKAKTKMIRKIKQDIKGHFGVKTNNSIKSGSKYIPVFCSALKLRTETRELATKIIMKAEELELTNGRKPAAIAAVAIDIASECCDDRCKKKDIAKIAGISSVTLGVRRKEFTKHKGFDSLLDET
jgi:transcription initiation factor TFIIB